MAKRGNAMTYIQIYDYLKDKLILHENGVCEYRPGWSDSGIAKALDCSFTSVRTVRKQLYGPLKGAATENDNLKALYVSLETRIMALEKAEKDCLNAIENLEHRADHIERWGRQRGLEAIPGRMHKNGAL